MTIITRANCPYQQPRYEYEQPIAKGKVRHYKTNYKTMIHGLRLRLDREPTAAECYRYLLEVNCISNLNLIWLTMGLLVLARYIT